MLQNLAAAERRLAPREAGLEDFVARLEAAWSSADAAVRADRSFAKAVFRRGVLSLELATPENARAKLALQDFVLAGQLYRRSGVAAPHLSAWQQRARRRVQEPNHYTNLLLLSDCDQSEVKPRYRALLLANHPDKVRPSAAAAEEQNARFRSIQEAFEVLGDAQKRARYDGRG